MDLVTKTGAIKLRSHLDKYLVGDEDRETVRQSRNGATKRAIWIVEPSEKNTDAVKLKNLHTSLYLTASDTPFLFGVTGKRVLQLSIFDANRVEWEPLSDGFQVKFRTKDGKYLRANGGTPPWRNSVTYDSPYTGGTYNWVMWDIEPVSMADFGSFFSEPMTSFNSVFSDELDGSNPVSPMSVISASSSFSGKKSSDSGTYSPPKPVGRLIYYHIADDYGDVNDAVEGSSFMFKGHSVAELTHKLKEETGLEDIYVCTRSPLNGKLYPLRLQLPPNTTTMHIVVVPSTSRLAEDFAKVRI